MTNVTQNLDNREIGQITIGACYRLPDFEFWNADSLIKMKELPDNSVKCILTDPPYKYLKNQKLEVDFDETIFFNEVKRVLKSDGFIVLFGRGTSFYRWNYMLSELGFIFKEEICWNKKYTSSPVTPITRVHETISIHSKNKGVVNNDVKIPYLESKQDIDSIKMDISRILSAIGNVDSLKAIIHYLETGEIGISKRNMPVGNGITVQSKLPKLDRGATNVMSICEGFKLKSIVDELPDRFNSIHPTQKPVRLLERLLALTTKEGDLVLDAFAGSCSTGHACLNTKRKFIGYEIDREYYEKAVERIKAVEPNLFSSGCL